MKFKVIGLGEVLWDLLPAGRQLGGAPANFSFHAKMLGADAWLISSVGNDLLGREILERLRQMQMASECVAVNPTAPTGSVSVTVAPDGQPTFVIRENVAWDFIAASASARSVVAQADAICFGSLAQRNPVSRAAIHTLLALARPEAYRVFDINLRQHFFSDEIITESLALANILKINDEELPVLARLFHLRGDTKAQLAELAERFDLKLVALTRGARGSLFYAQGDYSECAGFSSQVVDTVGAGDSFTATLVMGLLAGWDLDQINRHANQVAAYVVSQPGATPILPEQLRLTPGLLLNA
jgi:fructokinase